MTASSCSSSGSLQQMWIAMGQKLQFGNNANIQPLLSLWHADAFPIIWRHPLYHRNLCPNSQWKHILLGKIAASLKPFPKVGKYQPGMDTHAFSKENQVWWVRALGRLSSAGKGLVLVQNSRTRTLYKWAFIVYQRYCVLVNENNLLLANKNIYENKVIHCQIEIFQPLPWFWS